MIGNKQANKLTTPCQGTLTLKPLTGCRKFVSIITMPIKAKNDCKQSRFYLKVVRKMGVLQIKMNKEQARETSTLIKLVVEMVETHEKYANQQGENFNIFRILKMGHYEVKTHSRFIYELLDPKGSHGQNDIFLKSFVKKVLESKDFNTAKNPKREDLTDENRRIDFTLETNSEIFGIEMKIYADDQKQQLLDYAKELNERTKDEQKVKMFYLTLDGKEASEESFKDGENKTDYTPISFKNEILSWIKDCTKQSAEKSVLREALIQYKILIEKLTGQNEDLNMDIVEKLLENPKGTLAIYNNFDDFRTGIFQEFYKKIRSEFESPKNKEKIAKAKGWKVEFEKILCEKKKYHQPISIKNQNCVLYFTLEFLYKSGYCSYYGFCKGEQLKSLDKVNLTKIIESKQLEHLKFIGEKSTEEDWLTWDYFKEENLLEMIIEEDSEKLANEFVKNFIDFFENNLEAVGEVSEHIKNKVLPLF